MRGLLNIIVGTLAGLIVWQIPASAHAEALKPFDFMGYVAGQPIDAEKLKKCRNSRGDGSTSCVVLDAKLAGVGVSYSVTFYRQMLSSVYVEAHPDNFVLILDAFNTKYGTPCGHKVTVWQNAMGAKVDNPTFNWCFASGKLEVSRYGKRINRMMIFYGDENQAPRDQPKINF